MGVHVQVVDVPVDVETCLKEKRVYCVNGAQLPEHSPPENDRYVQHNERNTFLENEYQFEATTRIVALIP